MIDRYRTGEVAKRMIRDPDGNWVKWSDVAELVEAAQEARKCYEACAAYPDPEDWNAPMSKEEVQASLALARARGHLMSVVGGIKPRVNPYPEELMLGRS